MKKDKANADKGKDGTMAVQKKAVGRNTGTRHYGEGIGLAKKVIKRVLWRCQDDKAATGFGCPPVNLEEDAICIRVPIEKPVRNII